MRPFVARPRYRGRGKPSAEFEKPRHQHAARWGGNPLELFIRDHTFLSDILVETFSSGFLHWIRDIPRRRLPFDRFTVLRTGTHGPPNGPPVRRRAPASHHRGLLPRRSVSPRAGLRNSRPRLPRSESRRLRL